MLHETMDVYLI